MRFIEKQTTNLKGKKNPENTEPPLEKTESGGEFPKRLEE